MKQKLINLLKTSFASKGFNAKELESLADLIISQQSLTDDSTDEDLTTAVTGAKPVADFVQSVASRQVSDVKKPKVEEPKNDPPKNDPDPNETATEKLLREILEGQKSQAAELAALKADKVGSSQKAQLEALIKDADQTFKDLKLEAFEGRTFTDEEFTAFLEKTKPQVETHVQDLANRGLGGDQPAGGHGAPAGGKKEASAAEVDAAVDSIIKI